MLPSAFIDKFKFRLQSSGMFYNPDTELQPAEEWESNKVKLLIVFPSPFSLKSLSTTKEALNEFVRFNCPGVFIDFAYLPERLVDRPLYDKFNMPLAISEIKHKGPDEFDLVGFSISVLYELFNVPQQVTSFSRCGIKATWSERKDMQLGRTPVVFAGGITSIYSDILFGEIKPRQTAWLDFLYLGECGRLKQLLDIYGQAKQAGCTVQQFIDQAFVLGNIYQPQAYEIKFENKKLNPAAPDYVQPYYPTELPFPTTHTIINGDGSYSDVANLQISQGCGTGCTFCAEGTIAGHWIQQEQDKLVKAASDARMFSAASQLKLQSFNCNYYQGLNELVAELKAVYPEVSFSNMRLEELGQSKDQMKLVRDSTSYGRFTAPIEGISDRIRNNLFNKQLSLSSIKNFFKNLVDLRVSDVRVGAIISGYEEQQDWTEFIELLEEVSSYFEQASKRLPLRLSVAPLCHYPLTPLYGIARLVAKKAFMGEKLIPSDVLSRLNALGVKVKIRGFSHTIWVEQIIVDCGRLLTPWLQQYIVEPAVPGYSFRDKKALMALRGFVSEAHFGQREQSVYDRVKTVFSVKITIQAKDITSKLLGATQVKKCQSSIKCKVCDGCIQKQLT